MICARPELFVFLKWVIAVSGSVITNSVRLFMTSNQDTESTEHGIQEAIRMFESGATPGMVRAKLRKMEFSEDKCNDIVAQSQKLNTSSNRKKGLWSLLSGAALVVVGASLMVFRFSQGTSNARPLVMIVVGLGLLANGMLTAYSGVGGQAD